MTQAQEYLSGVDAHLALNGQVLGAIQFKAPYSPPKDLADTAVATEHRFTLTHPQLERLQSLAPRLGGRVIYALPCVNRWVDVQRLVPNLIDETYILRASALDPTAHRVIVSQVDIEVRSRPTTFPKISIVHVIDEWIAAASNNADGEPDRRTVTGWLNELADQSQRDKAPRQAERRSIAQSLRGLALIVSPPEPVPAERAQ